MMDDLFAILTRCTAARVEQAIKFWNYLYSGAASLTDSRRAMALAQAESETSFEKARKAINARLPFLATRSSWTTCKTELNLRSTRRRGWWQQGISEPNFESRLRRRLGLGLGTPFDAAKARFGPHFEH